MRSSALRLAPLTHRGYERTECTNPSVIAANPPDAALYDATHSEHATGQTAQSPIARIVWPIFCSQFDEKTH